MARLLSFYTLVYSRKSFHRIVTQVVALAADNQAYQAVHRPQTSALGKADDNNDDAKKRKKSVDAEQRYAGNVEKYLNELANEQTNELYNNFSIFFKIFQKSFRFSC